MGAQAEDETMHKPLGAQSMAKGRRDATGEQGAARAHTR